MLKKYYLLLLALLLSSAGFVNAQEPHLSCSTLPADIKLLYDRSQYAIIVYEADSLLKHCNYDAQDLEQIYIYMIAASLEYGDDSLYLAYSKKLLELDPHYEYQGSEPSALKNIRNMFKIYPKLTLGMSVGFDKVLVDRINVYQVFDSADATEPYFSFPALTASFLFQYNLSRRISIGYDVGVYFSNFTKNIYLYSGFLTTTYKETIQGIGNSVLAKINFPLKVKRGQYIPYVMAGGFFDYKIREGAKISLSVDTSVYNYPDFTIPVAGYSINYRLRGTSRLFTPMRTPFNYGYLFGFGVNYVSRNMTFFTEIFYQKAFLQNNNPDVRFLNPILRNFYYIDDDILLNKVYLRFGFTLNFNYKVKRR